MEYIFLIVIAVAMGFWCRILAERKGRNVDLAFVLGFLFGLLGVLGYYLISTTRDKKIRDAKDLLAKR